MKITKQCCVVVMSILGPAGTAVAPATETGGQRAAQKAGQSMTVQKVHVLSRAELDRQLSEPDKILLIDLVRVSNHAARASRAAALLDSRGFRVVGAAGAEVYEKQGGVLTKFPAHS